MNWYFWTVVLEKTLESPLDWRKIQPVNPKGNQSWIFTGITDAEAETPILWPPDAMSWLIWKDPDAGKDWRQEETGMTEDEMAGWYHWVDGHEFEQAPGVGDGQGSLVCCSPWVTESDTTEGLNWTECGMLCLWFLVSYHLEPISLGKCFLRAPNNQVEAKHRKSNIGNKSFQKLSPTDNAVNYPDFSRWPDGVMLTSNI